MSHETMNDLSESVRSQVSDLLNNRSRRRSTSRRNEAGTLERQGRISLACTSCSTRSTNGGGVRRPARERVVQLAGPEGTARVVAERSELPEYPLTISTARSTCGLSSACQFRERIRRPSTRRRSGDVDSSTSARRSRAARQVAVVRRSARRGSGQGAPEGLTCGEARRAAIGLRTISSIGG